MASILDLLRDGKQTAGELAARFPISRPAVSRHVRVLRDAGLVRQSRDRQTLHYSLNPAPLAAVAGWLTGYRVFWVARLHDLKRFVELEPQQPQDPKTSEPQDFKTRKGWR